MNSNFINFSNKELIRQFIYSEEIIKSTLALSFSIFSKLKRKISVTGKAQHIDNATAI